MRCPYCGKELKEGAKFCKYCGGEIKTGPKKLPVLPIAITAGVLVVGVAGGLLLARSGALSRRGASGTASGTSEAGAIAGAAGATVAEEGTVNAGGDVNGAAGGSAANGDAAGSGANGSGASGSGENGSGAGGNGANGTAGSGAGSDAGGATGNGAGSTGSTAGNSADGSGTGTGGTNGADNSGAGAAGSGTDRSGSSGTSAGGAGSSSAVSLEGLHFQSDAIYSSNRYTYDDMMDDLRAMAGQFGDRMTLRSAGTSYDGRDIAEVVLGDVNAQKHVIIQYSIHAREYINTLIAMKQLEDYLVNYDCAVYSGKSYRDLMQGLCFHVLPMTNPDGVMISQDGPDAIKDSSLKDTVMKVYESDRAAGRVDRDYWGRWKANARGVDLNRNFDSGWGTYEGRSTPSSERYKGTSAASEKETQAILAIERQYPVVCCISYHSSGATIYYDYGSSGAVYEADKTLAALMGNTTGYYLSSSVQTSQDAAGCSDYFVLSLGIPAVTIETGTESCPLPLSDLDRLYKENRQVWGALAAEYGSGGSGAGAAGGAGQNGNASGTESGAVTRQSEIIILGELPDDELEVQPLGEEMYYADVYEYLTLRSAASTSASALALLPAFTEMYYIEDAADPMVKVQVAGGSGLIGYVNQDYITRMGSPAVRASRGSLLASDAGLQSSSSDVIYYADVYESLTLRSAASTSASAVGYVEPFGAMRALEHKVGMVRVVSLATGETGWVNSDYIVLDPALCVRAGANSTSSTDFGSYRVNANEFITLRDYPSTSGRQIERILTGHYVTVLEKTSSTFWKVRAESGNVGYVMCSYLVKA